MREIRSNQINEIIKKSKQSVLISLIVMICAIAICVLSFGMKDFKESTSFHEFIANGEKAEDKFVHIEVSEKPYGFAYYPDDSTGKFYFLWDEEYMYIAFLSEEEFNKLNVDDIKENHITVKGFTKTIPSDIKQLAIDAYNENVEEDYKISSSDFASYFGLVYLDETEPDFVATICLVIGGIVSMVGFCMFIGNGINSLRLKSRFKKISDEEWEILDKELDADSAFYYKSAKLSLTEHYIVDFAHGLQAIKYDDLLWMYKYEYRYKGFNTQLSIILYTNDKKRHVLAALPGYTKKSKEINKEIIETIMEKNKNIVVGYNRENRKYMKENYQIRA